MSRGRRSIQEREAAPSVMWGSRPRSPEALRRAKAYSRARERTRHAVAMLYRAEFDAAWPKETRGKSGTTEYWRRREAALRAVVANHRDDYERILREEIVKEFAS